LTLTADLQGSQGEKQRAIESYKKAVSLYQILKSPRAEAKALNNLGVVLLELGEVNQALEVLRQVFEISTRET
jgi:tetratricopeptide (TPR) repeat protein